MKSSVKHALLAAVRARRGRADRLSLCVEPHKGADFQLLDQVELRG